MSATGIALVLLAPLWGDWTRDLGFTLVGSALTFAFFGLYFDLRAQEQLSRSVAEMVLPEVIETRRQLQRMQDRLELGESDYPVRAGGYSHGLREVFSRNECPARVRKWISELGPRVTIMNDYDWLLSEQVIESVLTRHPHGQVQILVADDSQPSASQLWSLRHRSRPDLASAVQEVARKLEELERNGIGPTGLSISGRVAAGKADMVFLDLAVVDESDSSAVFVPDPNDGDPRYERLTLLVNGSSKYGEAVSKTARNAVEAATPLLSQVPAKL